MSDVDFASGIGYNALQPTLADTPIIPFADLAVTNPPESPVPIALQAVPTVSALSAQGPTGPVLLQADATRKLIVTASGNTETVITGPVTAPTSTVPVASTLAMTPGQSILYVPLDGTGLLAGPVERHLVTRVGLQALTFRDPIRTSGAVGSLIVELPDVQTEAAITEVLTGLTTGAFMNINFPIDERTIAIGLLIPAFGDFIGAGFHGHQSFLTMPLLSGYMLPGLYLYPAIGAVDSQIDGFLNNPVAGDNFTILAFKSLPDWIANSTIGRDVGQGRFSEPIVGVQSFIQFGAGFPFGETITKVVAVLRGGGVAADNARLVWTPNLTLPAFVTPLAELGIPAVAGAVDRIVLENMALPIDPVNGSQLGFFAAPAPTNFQRVYANMLP